MSREKLVKTLNSEIREINEIIDMKVIRGVSYRTEAKRHKLLVRMLQDVNRRIQSRSAWSFASFLF
jgi:hypothetical protein